MKLTIPVSHSPAFRGAGVSVPRCTSRAPCTVLVPVCAQCGGCFLPCLHAPLTTLKDRAGGTDCQAAPHSINASTFAVCARPPEPPAAPRRRPMHQCKGHGRAPAALRQFRWGHQAHLTAFEVVAPTSHFEHARPAVHPLHHRPSPCGPAAPDRHLQIARQPWEPCGASSACSTSRCCGSRTRSSGRRCWSASRWLWAGCGPPTSPAAAAVAARPGGTSAGATPSTTPPAPSCCSSPSCGTRPRH